MPEPRKRTAAKKTAAKKTSPSSRSGDPRKTGPKPSSIADWKKRKQLDHKVLKLPSGLSIECDRTDVMAAFVHQGLMPNRLMSIVTEHIEKGTPMGTAEAKKMVEDESQMADMFEMMDNVIVFISREPEVTPLPTGKQRRKTDLLYVDELEEQDKMFLFQWATGGTDDLETFREESRTDLADLFRGQGAGVPAKRARGPRKR